MIRNMGHIGIAMVCVALLLVVFTSNKVMAGSVQEFSRIITTPASNGGPQVRIMDSEGSEITNFFAFPSWYRSGFQSAVGDINDDGETEIVVAPGQGLGPNIRIFTTGGNLIGQFNAYNDAFRGGVNVAVGDIDGDGVNEIITAPAGEGGPNVRFFNYVDGQFIPTTKNFLAFDKNFRGGVNIAAADIDGDGIHELLTVPRRGAPHVKIYGVRDGEFQPTTPGFKAYSANFRGGVNIAAGDLDADGKDEIITAPASDGGPHIKIFGMKNNRVSLLSPGFFAYDEDYRDGVTVTTGDINLDGKHEIVNAIGGQESPLIRVFNEEGFQTTDEFYAYADSFKGGVNVSSAKIYLKTVDKLIYAQGSGRDSNANAVLREENSSSYVLQTQFKLLDRNTTSAYTKFHSSYFGVYLRFEDINNWVRVDFSEAYRPANTFWARLLIKENGRYKAYDHHQLVGYDIDSLFNSWHDLMVEDSGSQIKAYLDDVLVLNATYNSDIQVGQKGFLSNISTRSIWKDFTVTSSASADGMASVDIGVTSRYKYGGDWSWYRYSNIPRYILSANPYYELATDSNFTLPEKWTRGDGLWIVLNDNRKDNVEEQEATPPAASNPDDETSVNRLIYAQGDGSDNNLNIAIKSENSIDYTLDTKFKLLDSIETDDYTRFHSSYFGVVLRFQDSHNFLRVTFATAYRPAGKLYVGLLLSENGRLQYIQNIPVEGYDPAALFSSWHDLRIVDNASNIKVILDGETVLGTDYSTDIASGMKGYISNIATRSVWENMTITSRAVSSSPVTTNVNTGIPSYGYDISSSRYSSDSRYNITENPLYDLIFDPDYLLTTDDWSTGSGLWVYKGAAYFL